MEAFRPTDVTNLETNRAEYLVLFYFKFFLPNGRGELFHFVYYPFKSLSPKKNWRKFCGMMLRLLWIPSWLMVTIDLLSVMLFIKINLSGCFDFLPVYLTHLHFPFAFLGLMLLASLSTLPPVCSILLAILAVDLLI